MKITDPANRRFSSKYCGILSFILSVVIANVIHFATHQNDSPHVWRFLSLYIHYTPLLGTQRFLSKYICPSTFLNIKI